MHPQLPLQRLFLTLPNQSFCGGAVCNTAPPLCGSILLCQKNPWAAPQRAASRPSLLRRAPSRVASPPAAPETVSCSCKAALHKNSLITAHGFTESVKTLFSYFFIRGAASASRTLFSQRGICKYSLTFGRCGGGRGGRGVRR